MKFLSLIFMFLFCVNVFAQDLTKDIKYIFEFRDATTIIGSDDSIALGGPGVRYYRKINRVSSKNGSGAKTFDIQLFMSSLINGSIIPMFVASQRF